MRSSAFQAGAYRHDRLDFVEASWQWNMVRSYVLIFAVPTVAFFALFGWAVHSDASSPREPVQAVVTESSRPLDDVAKAPVDWTGDGKADGWLNGEWLPGDTGTVYLRAGDQVAAPMPTVGYAAIGLILFMCCLLVYLLAGWFLFDSLSRSAARAAERDWNAARRQISVSDHADEGVPLWAY